MRDPGRPASRLLWWLARKTFARRTGSPQDPASAERVLVVRADERVGNLVLLEPLFSALRRSRPGIRIGLLAARRMEIAARALGPDDLFLIEKRDFMRRPSRWLRVVRAVRAAAYPVAIDGSSWHEASFTHNALAHFSGAPVVCSFRRPGPTLATHLVDPGPADEYEVTQRLRLLLPLGITAACAWPRLDLDWQEPASLAPWLDALPRPRIGLWPGARKAENRWPTSRFARLGERLAGAAGGTRIVLWGPGEEPLRDALLRPPQTVAAPPTDLVALAGLLRRLDLLVINDTGPMHLAVALGTPTVALFTATSASRFGHPALFVKNLSVGDPAEPEEVELARVMAACSMLLSAKMGS
ncbi:MAG: glycosyltransferase family 9 protein [Myxococcales bacterium]|nr:glycosyltransferase family 9 protein [Myxococcales bacterium]